jgi:drug/metabolite transporter (DMT)-like permease
MPLLPWALRERHTIPWKTGIWAGIWLFLAYYLQTEGLVFTGPDRAAFITGLNVLAIPLLNYLLYRRPLSPRMAISAGFMLLGLALFLGPKGGLNLGDVLIFGTAILLAGQVLVTAKMPPAASWVGFTFVELAVTAVLSWLTTTFQPAPVLTSGLLASVLYIGVIATTLAILGQTWGQRLVPPFQAGLIFVFEPIFAAIFGLSLGHRTITWLEALGGVIMVAALVGYEWLGQAPRRAIL